MERHLGHLRLFPGTESEFDRRHAAIPHELAEAIRSSGLRNVTSFRRGTDVWIYVEAEPSFEDALDRLARSPAAAGWAHSLRTIVAEGTSPRGGGGAMFEEVFHSDGPKLDGQLERGLFAMVVDPERVTEYDDLHAHPWPDMIAALSDSGFCNYSGFRRGAQVVYYGEFHPDMATAFGTIGQTGVNGRWGAAFEGIVITITDGDGGLIAASAVFHQN